MRQEAHHLAGTECPANGTSVLMRSDTPRLCVAALNLAPPSTTTTPTAATSSASAPSSAAFSFAGFGTTPTSSPAPAASSGATLVSTPVALPAGTQAAASGTPATELTVRLHANAELYHMSLPVVRSHVPCITGRCTSASPQLSYQRFMVWKATQLVNHCDRSHRPK